MKGLLKILMISSLFIFLPSLFAYPKTLYLLGSGWDDSYLSKDLRYIRKCEKLEREGKTYVGIAISLPQPTRGAPRMINKGNCTVVASWRNGG